jgi:hypothetical protein
MVQENCVESLIALLTSNNTDLIYRALIIITELLRVENDEELMNEYINEFIEKKNRDKKHSGINNNNNNNNNDNEELKQIVKQNWNRKNIATHLMNNESFLVSVGNVNKINDENLINLAKDIAIVLDFIISN